MAPIGYENPGSGDVQIKMLRNTVVDGQDVKKGDIVTTSKREAQVLLRGFDAVRVEPEAKPAAAGKKSKAEKAE